MEGCLPGGTRPNTPHHHMGLWLQATVQMRLCRGCAQGGVWWKRGGGRAGARQGRTAQNSGRMFVFAATLVPRRRDIRHGNVGERENPNPGNHHGLPYRSGYADVRLVRVPYEHASRSGLFQVGIRPIFFSVLSLIFDCPTLLITYYLLKALLTVDPKQRAALTLPLTLPLTRRCSPSTRSSAPRPRTS